MLKEDKYGLCIESNSIPEVLNENDVLAAHLLHVLSDKNEDLPPGLGEWLREYGASDEDNPLQCEEELIPFGSKDFH